MLVSVGAVLLGHRTDTGHAIVNDPPEVTESVNEYAVPDAGTLLNVIAVMFALSVVENKLPVEQSIVTLPVPTDACVSEKPVIVETSERTTLPVPLTETSSRVPLRLIRTLPLVPLRIGVVPTSNDAPAGDVQLVTPLPSVVRT